MEVIRDDELVSAERFKAYLASMGWHTQADAADALGVTQAYISKLVNGHQQAQPGTPFHKLLQALQREQSLVRRLKRSGGTDDGRPTP
ncbi:MAG TPA: helix-turn-helix transcriptional regulator [Longimicrobium sp.]